MKQSFSWLACAGFVFALAACAEDDSNPVLTDPRNTPPEDCVDGRACDPETFTSSCLSIERVDCRNFTDKEDAPHDAPRICACVEYLPDTWGLRCHLPC